MLNVIVGIFDDDRYWDVEAEFAKSSPDDLLVKYTLHNRGPAECSVHVLPTLWFRNTWSWGAKQDDEHKPLMEAVGDDQVIASHHHIGTYISHTKMATVLKNLCSHHFD